MKHNDLISSIIRYEDGNMSENDTIALFGELVANGMAWTLQGSYGRMAESLIRNGYLNRKGEILKEV